MTTPNRQGFWGFIANVLSRIFKKKKKTPNSIYPLR